MNPKVVILDTNVCLDWFVFHEPQYRDFFQSIQNKTIKAITNLECKKEWLRILHYPNLPLNDASRKKCIEAFDLYIECMTFNMEFFPFLPVCTDESDQKFLELACAAKADFLVTKDKALLKLAKKIAKAGFFHIIHPSKWKSILN